MKSIVSSGSSYENQKSVDVTPIIISDESIIEGFIKTKKSIRIESDFYGTLLSTQKVIIDSHSNVRGDVVCSELLISGFVEGNIFCTGKITAQGNARIIGHVYTKLFENENTCDLNCIIEVPNNTTIQTIQEMLLNVDTQTKLSSDKTLDKIKESFLHNVYSYTKSAPAKKNEEKLLLEKEPIVMAIPKML